MGSNPASREKSNRMAGFAVSVAAIRPPARAVRPSTGLGGGDQPPFRSAGCQSAALEAISTAGDLGLGEDRLDHLLAAVEPASIVGVDHPLHVRVEAAHALIP